MKINLSLAVIAAVAMAVAASPSEAASKKKVAKAGKATKVTVVKPSAPWASSANVCFSNAATWWFPIAAVGSVGCGIVYAIPVGIEGFVVRQGGSKA